MANEGSEKGDMDLLDEEDKLFIYPLSEYFLDVSYGLMTLKEANTDEIITNFIDISKKIMQKM